MGVRPDGTPDANGSDVWWDEEGKGNCWCDNKGPSGLNRRATWSLPGCPGSDIGVQHGQAGQARQPSPCAAWDPIEDPDPPGCDWFTQPPEPK